MYIKIININTSNWATDRDIKYCRAEILCNYYYYSVKYTRTMFMYFSQTDFKCLFQNTAVFARLAMQEAREILFNKLFM